LLTNKSEKYRLPTREEMLSYNPKRGDFEWSVNGEGLIEIKVQKFKGKTGNSLCKLIRKDPYFTAKFDRVGSIVWKNCDGKKKVGDILKILQKELPKEKNLDQRLFLFIQQLRNLNYIVY
jgi:hypothetical protein